MVKAFKIAVTGQFRNYLKNVIEFDNVTGIIPYNEEEVIIANVIKRYASMWLIQKHLANPKKFEKPEHMRKVDIDVMEEIELDEDFSFVGKDIKEMDQAELQDLACAKDIRAIPLFKKLSDRDARTQAYVAYSALVLNKVIKYQEPSFNFIKLPKIIVKDSDPRKDITRVASVEETLEQEGKDNKVMPNAKAKTVLSRNDLEAIATGRNVGFNTQMTDDQLYKAIYG